MKTLLINPPYSFAEVPIIPMGLAYIAAVLERDGNDVQILDLLVSQHTEEKIRNKIEEYQPDIIGITCVTMNYPIASDILRTCKNINKDVTTIIGGPHVTFCPEQTLNEAPWIDIVVRGEGERTIIDIVNGKSLDFVDGIAFRSNGIRITAERELIENLDDLPFPARHLFPLSKYLALDCHCSLVTGRGCPFNCIFCVGSKMGGRRVRFRNIKLIVDEIELALSYGFKNMNMEDDLLTLNHRHVFTFCDEIMARGLQFNWSIFSRADTVNAELLHRMRQAGCNWMLYGVESGSQKILDTVKKKITLDKIREGVQLAKEADIKVMASFIIGLPGETRETLRESIQFAVELNTTWGFNVLSPFPGTEVRENAQDYGIDILTDDWTQYDANRAVTRTSGAGPDEIADALREYHEGLARFVADMERSGEMDRQQTQRSMNDLQCASDLILGDVIEKLGPIEANGEPLAKLADKLAEVMTYPLPQVRENVDKWASNGLLKYDLNGNYALWRWA